MITVLTDRPDAIEKRSLNDILTRARAFAIQEPLLRVQEFSWTAARLSHTKYNHLSVKYWQDIDRPEDAGLEIDGDAIRMTGTSEHSVAFEATFEGIIALRDALDDLITRAVTAGAVGEFTMMHR
jgi:hypothetical protein